MKIYDSIQSPIHKDTQFTESIYSEIIEPNTLITIENPQGGSVKDDKDLYPYSSIYAEPLPLDKSESPPLVTAQNLSETKLLGTGQFWEVTIANTVGLSELYLHLGKSEDSSIVLVGKDYIVKIADFGMSQNLYSAYYFKVKGCAVLPIRWMAYEYFFGKFSVKTDVWAFGITLWEIFTLAKEQPYHDMGDQEVINSALEGENRLLMIKPVNCPDEIYKVMLHCWVHDPTKRATFIELYDALKAIQINNGQ